MGLVEALLQSRRITEEVSQTDNDRSDALLLTLQESFDVLQEDVARLAEAVVVLGDRVTALEGD